MRLPAYPLITIDPFMSIWSMNDTLTAGTTQLWCGHEKTLKGTIIVDGRVFRFMGKGTQRLIPQTALEVTPLVTAYTFENQTVRLCVEFWTPLFLDDIHTMSVPCSFIDYRVTVLDGQSHGIEICLTMDENFCYDGKRKPVVGGEKTVNGIPVSYMAREQQTPLAYTGDGVGIDWGEFYLAGKDARFVRDNAGARLRSVHAAQTQTGFFATDIVAYDDTYSIEYLGQKLKGIWTERFADVYEAIRFCRDNADSLREKAAAWNRRLLSDAARFGPDYQTILTAAYRQVLAAHKLVRDNAGNLLYMSKECHSNGCINTVDVSYPSVPLFLLYNPALVRGMMNGIFEFARLPVWKGDFAPHDLGQYPVANGQVYALTLKDAEERRKVYTMSEEVFDFSHQMPVEECGNMLIMAYAYAVAADDTAFLQTNADLLKTWAEYLVKTGNELAFQLCTDDFAGALAQNVNLAMKSCVGIACYGRILALFGESGGENYQHIARQNAADLVARATEGNKLRLTFDKKASWSLKYNMIWDAIFDLDLFDEQVAANEIAQYYRVRNKYGVPLDSRKSFTKSDWLMWASALDESGETTKAFAKDLTDMLANTRNRVPFTDWYETKTAKLCWFWHRTVLGGLWMPLLRAEKNAVFGDTKRG